MLRKLYAQWLLCTVQSVGIKWRTEIYENYFLQATALRIYQAEKIALIDLRRSKPSESISGLLQDLQPRALNYCHSFIKKNIRNICSVSFNLPPWFLCGFPMIFPENPHYEFHNFLSAIVITPSYQSTNTPLIPLRILWKITEKYQLKILLNISVDPPPPSIYHPQGFSVETVWFYEQHQAAAVFLYC